MKAAEDWERDDVPVVVPSPGTGFAGGPPLW